MDYLQLLTIGLILLLLSGQLDIMQRLSSIELETGARHATDLISLVVLILGTSLTIYALARLLGWGA